MHEDRGAQLKIKRNMERPVILQSESKHAVKEMKRVRSTSLTVLKALLSNYSIQANIQCEVRES